jgi:hypothetical protein
MFYRTVRDFYSPGNFFAYVAWYRKAAKKIRTLKFVIGCMLPSSHVHLLTWGIGRSLTYLAVYATYAYVRTYVRYIELVASNNYNN